MRRSEVHHSLFSGVDKRKIENQGKFIISPNVLIYAVANQAVSSVYTASAENQRLYF